MAGITVKIEDGVALVEVNNPPVNAMTDEILTGLGDAAAKLAHDDRARVVVVVGRGERAFLAGADLREFVKLFDRPDEIRYHTSLTADVFAAWEAVPQPVIAVVHTNAVGGGLEFALICDFIVADPRARFSSPEVKLGLMPGAGATQRLPRRIGAFALEMLLLGEMIDAVRAKELGLVNLISQDGRALAEAEELATRLASLPTMAVRSIKEAVRLSGGDLAAGLARERELFHAVFASEDCREGATAFLEKRPPRFVHH